MTELEQLQKNYDDLKEQFTISMTYTAFVYGMAAAGDVLAIKLVKLHAKEDEPTYEIGINVKP